MLNKDNSTYEVLSVTAAGVQAVQFFGSGQPVLFPNLAKVEAAIRLKVGVEDEKEEEAPSTTEEDKELEEEQVSTEEEDYELTINYR
jgi:hypothetical protein